MWARLQVLASLIGHAQPAAAKIAKAQQNAAVTTAQFATAVAPLLKWRQHSLLN
jgi:hypothetical protein